MARDHLSAAAKPDLTIRELQTCLPWTVHYSSDFRATPMPHKDFTHGLTHVMKAGGALAALVDDLDHRKEAFADTGEWEAEVPLKATNMEAARAEAFAWANALPTEEEYFASHASRGPRPSFN